MTKSKDSELIYSEFFEAMWVCIPTSTPNFMVISSLYSSLYLRSSSLYAAVFRVKQSFGVSDVIGKSMSMCSVKQISLRPLEMALFIMSSMGASLSPELCVCK